jgi:hypothetical protein
MTNIPITSTAAAPASLALGLHEAIFAHFRQHGNDGQACAQIIEAIVALARDYEQADRHFRWRLIRKLAEARRVPTSGELGDAK